ncbi:MAG: hypothetical protein K2X86_06975, partial [Cytophagaceae bacterium]|nr:hypothetical protein [Cytophagaceae bacterium]
PSHPGYNEIIYCDTSSAIRPVHGTRVYTMYGNDLDGNYYSMNFGATQLVTNSFGINTQNISADDLYFNVYVYSYGQKGSRMSINFEEDDDADPINGPLAYNPTVDDAYKLILVLPEKEGWYLYSKKYADLPLSADANEGSNGNKIHEPAKLYGVNFVLLSTQPFLQPKLSLDYAIFTIGNPLPPIE